MKKKIYILLLILGSLLTFVLLPFFNYTIDQWRVLGPNYVNSYEGININKVYLKTKYLSENKFKYDTLLLGSSRNAALNEKMFSNKTYNMESTFSTVSVHLHNLKILLDTKSSIKHVVLGINDYDIWKDPSDFTLDYGRMLYSENFFDKLEFYKLYLFKKIDQKDIDIILGNKVLQKSNRILRENLRNDRNTSNAQDKKLYHNDKWIQKMSHAGGMTLGYKDTHHRINKSIQEIKSIKELCNKYNVKLTLFMYPSFYQTYIQYNQYKIEEFKLKLSSISNFHDFYSLNDISLNEYNWSDSSHFTKTVGYRIVDSIKNKSYLVTPETIDTHLKEVRQAIPLLTQKETKTSFISRFNPNIDLKYLKPIFNIKYSSYHKNDAFRLDEKNYFNYIKIHNNDPALILNNLKTKSKNVILSYEIESNRETLLQVFYKKTKSSAYSERNSYRVKVHRGLTKINLLISSTYLHNELRVDLISHIGKYKIRKLVIYE